MHCVQVYVIVCGCVALYVCYFVLLDVSLHVYVCTCHCVVCMSFRAGVLFFCVFLYFCIVSYLRFFVWFCLRFYVWLFSYYILCNCFCDFVHDFVFGLSCNFLSVAFVSLYVFVCICLFMFNCLCALMWVLINYIVGNVSVIVYVCRRACVSICHCDNTRYVFINNVKFITTLKNTETINMITIHMIIQAQWGTYILTISHRKHNNTH